MSLDDPTAIEQGPYRIDWADGTWWQFGWDSDAQSFVAERHHAVPYDPFTPEAPERIGGHGQELRSIHALTERVPVTIPPAILDRLDFDATFDFHSIDPARYRDLEIDDADEAEWVVAEAGRTSLPARQVADVLARLAASPGIDEGDPGRLAAGLGLDPDLVGGVLSGTNPELDLDGIAAVCEALRCSPYELWGSDLARQVLHAYGPEHWPAHIEPLSDLRAPSASEAFLRRRLDQLATDIAPLPAPASTTLGITAYAETGIVHVDVDGQTAKVTDELEPAEPGRAYYFAYRQLGAERSAVAPMPPGEFAASGPVGDQPDARLVALVEAHEVGHRAALIRLRDEATDTVRWLGRETPFDPWVEFGDPRLDFPGHPSDILDTASLDNGVPLPFDGSIAEAPASPGVELVPVDRAHGPDGLWV